MNININMNINVPLIIILMIILSSSFSFHLLSYQINPSFSPDEVFTFLITQLQDHDYVSNPLVYDVDEEFVASLLYSLAAVQTRDMYNERIDRYVYDIP